VDRAGVLRSGRARGCISCSAACAGRLIGYRATDERLVTVAAGLQVLNPGRPAPVKGPQHPDLVGEPGTMPLTPVWSWAGRSSEPTCRSWCAGVGADIHAVLALRMFWTLRRRGQAGRHSDVQAAWNVGDGTGYQSAGRGRRARQHLPGRTCAGDHHSMPGHRRAPAGITPVATSASHPAGAAAAVPDGAAANAAARRGRSAAVMARPSGSSWPPSSNNTTPLHSRLHPCSGRRATGQAAMRSCASASGHRG
jgi:hypothetical protein